MDWKKLIILILSLGVIGGLVLWYSLRGKDETTRSQNVNQISEAGFIRYTNEELGFSILHPEGTVISRETASGIKFLYLGPEALPNTEITDGFALIVSRDSSLAGQATLDSYAQARRAEVRNQGATDVSGLEVRDVSGMRAYRFSYRNALESMTTEYVFLPFSSTGFNLSYVIAEPGDRDYLEMIETMIESISFLPSASSAYVSLIDWPPTVQRLEQAYSCTPGGQAGARAGLTVKKIISGREYCMTEVANAAAGSTYTQYAYATRAGTGTLIATFSSRRVQCRNYDEPRTSECLSAQAAFNPDALAHEFIAPLLVVRETPPQAEPSTTSPPMACTLEAKICPDGTAVGRTGPMCEFAPCP